MSSINAVISPTLSYAAVPAAAPLAATAAPTWGSAGGVDLVAPASTSSTTAAAPVRAAVLGQPSGIDQLNYSGDPLGDLVIKTYAQNPIGLGSIEQAMDLVSAGMSFKPGAGANQARIPGSDIAIAPGNALGDLPPSAAANMSTSDFIARAQSGVAAGWQSLLAKTNAGESMQSGYIAMAEGIGKNLRRDERGMNAFDYQEQALQFQQDEIVRKMREQLGDPEELLAQLSLNIIRQGMIAREREKEELLMRLIISLIIGVQVPKGVADRLVELGMGDLVEELIQAMVGNGQNLSKSMVEQLQGLSGLGITLSIVQPQDTVEGQKEAARLRELAAAPTADGRLVDPAGRTVDPNAVNADLAQLLRRRDDGTSGTETGADAGARGGVDALRDVAR